MYQILKNIRRDKKIPVNVLANKIGLKTTAAYYKKENGNVKFTVDEAIIIAKELKESVENIFIFKEI